MLLQWIKARRRRKETEELKQVLWRNLAELHGEPIKLATDRPKGPYGVERP